MFQVSVAFSFVRRGWGVKVVVYLHCSHTVTNLHAFYFITGNLAKAKGRVVHNVHNALCKLMDIIIVVVIVINITIIVSWLRVKVIGSRSRL